MAVTFAAKDNNLKMTVCTSKLWRIKTLFAALLISLLILAGCTDNKNSIYSPPPQLLYQFGTRQQVSSPGLWMEDVAWSPDGKMLASASLDRSVRVWDIASRQTIKQFTFLNSATIVAWSRDNKYLATISAEPGSDLKIWDTSAWRLITQIDLGKELGFTPSTGGVAWSPDSKYLAVSPNDYQENDVGRVKVYDTSTWQVAMTEDSPNGVGGAAWSPDGASIAFGSTTAPGGSEATLNIWDIHTNKVMTLKDADIPFYERVAWSPDGQYIAGAQGGTGRGSTDIAVWDVKAGKKFQMLKGHSFSVTSVAWSPDSKKLAAGYLDETARIWDAVGGQELASFKHSDDVHGVAWSPDGKMLATACEDAQVYVWDVK